MHRAAALCGVLGVLAPPAAAEGIVIERILAVVDGRPVTLTEVALLEVVRGLPREAAVEAAVDERLMYDEAARLPQAAVTAEDEERALRSLLERTDPATSGIPEANLRRLARREVTILKYVEFRFRPQVRITDEAVRQAYEAQFAGVPEAPSLEAAAPALRTRLEDAELGERIEAWVRELRASAEIRYNVGAGRR